MLRNSFTPSGICFVSTKTYEASVGEKVGRRKRCIRCGITVPDRNEDEIDDLLVFRNEKFQNQVEGGDWTDCDKIVVTQVHDS